MSEPKRYRALMTSFENGDYSIQTATGEHLIISLGPAQVISSHRDFDKYIQTYEAAEKIPA